MKVLSTTTLFVTATLMIFASQVDAQTQYWGNGTGEVSDVGAAMFDLEELAPFTARGRSPQLGIIRQSGTIDFVTPPFYDFSEKYTYVTRLAVQGPNPWHGDKPRLVVDTRLDGAMHCTWVGSFTLRINNDTGEAMLSGSGICTVVGGTGKFVDALGEFDMEFESPEMPDLFSAMPIFWKHFGELKEVPTVD